ncbi:S-layer homology domain-containing protein [Paenibacillus campi]|uniref:S-layer homology domain-containing protein n=1 Tax=Paenibacillus campi TaxID=3106031 RepID=UPI002AFDD04D|nr:S-layer homology domain-containing protein [Paenibacillus sp. SGZ-1014]
MKKLLSMLLAVVLLAGLLPQGWGTNQVFAADPPPAKKGSFFIFPNEQYDISTPRIANSDRLTVTGSYSNINTNSITYDVEQISNNGGNVTVINSNTGLSGNVTASTSGGSNLTIADIPLFAGLNRITFRATQGVASQVAESIYVDYRNGPTLYNLTAVLDNDTVALKENTPVVLTAAKGGINDGQPTANMSLSGSAPNATKVTVLVNGSNSRTSLVSSANNYQFTVAPIALKLGKNTLTIQAINGTQVLETTRDVTFYNGLTTFYDTFAQSGSSATSADLSTFPDFSVAQNTFSVTGKVVVPLTNGMDPKTVNLTNYITYTYSGAGLPDGALPANYTGKVTPTIIQSATTTAYMTLQYTIPENPSTQTFNYDKGINLLVQTNASSSTGFGLTLRNSTAAYIYKVNYLAGYTSTTDAPTAQTMTGTTLDGANIFSLPTALEMFVVNGDSTTTMNITNIVDSTGKNVTLTADNLNYTLITSESVVQTVNGNAQRMQRLLYKLNKVPVNGTQTLSFTATTGSKTTAPVSATINVLFGPYASFNKAYDGMVIPNSQNVPGASTRIITNTLDNFSGKLQNVTNQADIRYVDDGTGKQTVFFYVNNTLVPLVPANGTPNDPNFKIQNVDKAYNAMFSGQNTVKVVFKTDQTSYELSININLVPTDVPVIPVDTTLGIFPFKYTGGSDTIPAGPDAAFKANGTAYTTKESNFNIYGTFDFIDLGTSAAGVNSVLGDSTLNKDNYILEVTKSDGSTVATWTLSKGFTSTTGDPFNGGSNAGSPLSVFYDYTKQSFSFIVRGQAVPTDGSPVVYNFNVYNTGKGGPSSSARMEISAQTDAYTIARPLAAEKLTNSNFIDVVVNSKNATAVVINKQTATKAPFYTDPDGKANGKTPEYPDAYKITVTNLKPNKDTKIPIVVTIAGQQIKDEVVVKYVPTNIPGAQFMQTMQNSAKIFDGDLNLKFPTGTNLTRRDIGTTAADQRKNEVFSGNTLLFGIGNSQDGVINRYNFEQMPTNIDQKFKVGQQIFVNQFNNHFVMSSPVFWIDPGLADNLDSSSYDPVTMGQDPYQPSSSNVPSFYERDPRNELVPSKRGTLTLAYSDSVAQDAGKLVTVFFFDRSLGNSSGQWEDIGGVVNAKNHTVTVPFDRFGYYVVAKLSYSYTDIVQHSYARDYMEALFAKGIMKATDPDSSFGADQYITRGEFTRAIVRAMQLPFDYQGPKHFIDVSSNDSQILPDALYDYRYIETAARAGFIRGTQPQVFSPGDSITRQDAAVIIAKALNLKLQTDQTKIDAALQKVFKDASTVDRYARASVLAVAKQGLISGSAIDGDAKKGFNFTPTAKMLRSDTAVILAKVMISDKMLPPM